MIKEIVRKENKAIVFTRVSTREQEDGYSIEAQVERLNEYCHRKNLEVIDILRITESSTRGERAEFHKMIKTIKNQKGCVAIVCDKVDRLQRSFRELPILDELRRSGKIEMHFYTEGQILTKDSNSSQIMAYQMYIMMAESYTNAISDNVRRSFDHIVKTEKKYPHKALVGYVNIKDENGKATIDIDPVMGAIVSKIFREYATGIYSLADITRKACEWGFKTAYNKGVHKQTIRNILCNTFYYGYMNHKGKKYSHIHPRLTDEKTFKQCQDVLNKRMNHKVRKREDVYRGMIFCADCHYLITPDIKGNDGQYRYLLCSHCKGTCINEQIADAEVKKLLCKLKKIPQEWLEKTLQEVNAEINKEQKIKITERACLKARLSKLKSKEEALLDTHLEGSITRDLYIKKLEENKKEQEKINNELVHYSTLAHKSLISLKDLILLISRVDKIYDFSNFEEKRQILNLLYSKMELKGKSCLFSIRKPVEILLSTGLHQSWLLDLDSNQD